MIWKQYLHDLSVVLGELEVTEAGGARVDVDAAYRRLVGWIRECAERRRRIYMVGNGASASMASHFSTDLAKMSGAPTEVFTDPALISAIGNDMGYAETFAYPLRQRMLEGEVLVAVSSSGGSPNVVQAVGAALKLGGRVATFTAMRPDNAVRALGHLNFYIPADTYGMAESGHAAMLHHLVDLFSC